MPETKTLVLNHQKIQQMLERIAYQIYENNFEEKEIVVVGIQKKGYTLAQKIVEHLSAMSKLKVSLIGLTIDKKNPIAKKTGLSDEKADLSGKSVILIDDVLNSGKTLIYAAKFLLNFELKNLATVVLVDRKHRKYPIKADFVGLTLSTTIQEHITVVFGGTKDAVYLE